jgi:hypothetical protein
VTGGKEWVYPELEWREKVEKSTPDKRGKFGKIKKHRRPD